MLGKPRDPNLLVIPLCVRKELDEDGDTATVDVGIDIEFYQYFGCTLCVCVLVGFLKKGFRKGGDVALNIQDSNGTVLLNLDFVFLPHRYPFLPPN